MIKIGVTGSIASGKTTVARMLAEKKYPFFNADREVKKIYKSTIFTKKICKAFKLKNKKNIKNKVKKIISKDQNCLKILEKIIHPIVRGKLKNFTKANMATDHGGKTTVEYQINVSGCFCFIYI